MKTMIIGDLHLRENLGYADYIKDRRVSEKKDIFDFLVKESNGCDNIVFMGDIFNGRNNPSQIIKELVTFLKRFGNKKLFLLAGNHDKKTDGRSAIDFLQEMKIPNWTVITDEVTVIDDMVFCPYFSRQELGEKTNEAATAKLMKMLTGKKNKMLFVHHAISGTSVTKNTTTDLFDEIVLKKKELEAKYDFVCGGHIHKPTHDGKTLITGSIFNNEVGEDGKYLWWYNGKDVTSKLIPGRGVYKFEDDITLLNGIPKDSIVKFILTKKQKAEDLIKIKSTLKANTDAYLLLERYQGPRKKINMEGVSLDFEPESMLEVYAKERKVDLIKLKKAYKLINK